jgi:hypothetical protein
MSGEKVKEEEEWEEEEERGGGDLLVVTNDVRDIEHALYEARLTQPVLLRVRQRWDSSHAGDSVGVGTRSPPLPLLTLLPLSPDEFYDPGLAFGWDDEDNNYDVGKVLQGWGRGEERTVTTTAETAVGGSAPKHYRSRRDGTTMRTTLLRASVTLAPPRASLADILLGRRNMVRKMLSRGDDNDDNGVNYGVTTELMS